MMNVIEIQDKLKNFSQDQLINEMQMPSGSVPQYLVLSEINRRKRMQDSYQQEQNAQKADQTVAQEKLAAAGVPEEGIASLAAAMSPKTDMAQNTGATPQQRMPAPQAPPTMAEAMPPQMPPPQMPPPQMMPPQGAGIMSMAAGGPVQRMQVGGRPTYVRHNGSIYDVASDGVTVTQFGEPVPEDIAREVLSQNYANTQLNRRLSKDAIRASDEVFGGLGRFLFGKRTPTPSDLGEMSPAYNDTSLAAPPITNPMANDYGMMSPAANDTPIADVINKSSPPMSMSQYMGLAYQDKQPKPVDFDASDNKPTEIESSQIEAIVDSINSPMSKNNPLFIRGLAEQWYGKNPKIDAALKSAGFNPSSQLVKTKKDITGPEGGILKAGSDLPASEAERLNVPFEPSPFVLTGSNKPINEFLPPEFIEYETMDTEGESSIDRNGMYPPLVGPARPDQPRREDRKDQAKISPSTDFSFGDLSSVPELTLPEILSGTSSDAKDASTAATAEEKSTTEYTPLESEIIDMLKKREKRADQDKWMALAQAGLAMMASKQPTLLGAAGEAGMIGMQQLSKSREAYDDAKLALLGLRQKIDAARETKATASKKATREYYNDLIDDTRSQLDDLLDDARSYRKLETDAMGEAKLIDKTPPGLQANIVALEKRLQRLMAARGGSSMPSFDATRPIARAAGQEYSFGSIVPSVALQPQ